MTLEEQLEQWFSNELKVYIIFIDNKKIGKYPDLLTTDIKGLIELKINGFNLEKDVIDHFELYLNNYFIPDVSYSNWSDEMILKYSIRLDLDFGCYIIRKN